MASEKKNLKVFGYGLAVILALITFKVWREHGWRPIHVFLTGGLIYFCVVTTANYKSLLPIYTRWMIVARLIGSVITGIILTIMFYLIFGVTGLILRLIRKDILDRQLDPQARSYWTDRKPIKFEPEQYTRQF